MFSITSAAYGLPYLAVKSWLSVPSSGTSDAISHPAYSSEHTASATSGLSSGSFVTTLSRARIRSAYWRSSSYDSSV